jgi:hypothetical protein
VLSALNEQHTQIAIILHKQQKHKELYVQIGCLSSCLLCTLETLDLVSQVSNYNIWAELSRAHVCCLGQEINAQDGFMASLHFRLYMAMPF